MEGLHIEVLDRKGKVVHKFTCMNACLKALRKKSGMTQKQVGALLKVSHQRVHYMENNGARLQLEKLVELVLAYDHELLRMNLIL